MDAGISATGHIAITVSDVQKALDFYRDIPGLAFCSAPARYLHS